MQMAAPGKVERPAGSGLRRRACLNWKDHRAELPYGPARAESPIPEHIMRNILPAQSIRRAAVGILALAAFLVPAPLAAARADPADRGDRTPVISLPGATGAEGIAAGKGTTFFAGDLLNGNIYRGDIDEGTAELFITAPEGRAAVGMKVDRDNDLLFVAGGGTGQAYVYDLATQETVKVYELAPAGAGFINDVAVTRDGAVRPTPAPASSTGSRSATTGNPATPGPWRSTLPPAPWMRGSTSTASPPPKMATG